MGMKWIAYGVTGALGLTAVAGSAVAVANAMELRTETGQVIAGGVISGTDAPFASGAIDMSGFDFGTPTPSESSSSTPSPEGTAIPQTPATPSTAPSVRSAPTPPAPEKAPVPAPVSPVSPVSPDTPPSADSVDSADSD